MLPVRLGWGGTEITWGAALKTVLETNRTEAGSRLITWKKLAICMIARKMKPSTMTVDRTRKLDVLLRFGKECVRSIRFFLSSDWFVLHPCQYNTTPPALTT